MLKKLKYFQTVVRLGSFSEAAEECFISQSAISQQIKSLEEEIGVTLITRKNRSFELTPAGEYFYRRIDSIIKDFESIVEETRHMSALDKERIKFGILSGFDLEEFSQIFYEFQKKFSNIDFEIIRGDHEELFTLLKNSKIDLILSDQRRRFSDDYYNFEIGLFPIQLECESRLIKDKLTLKELEKQECFFISSRQNSENEKQYYRDIVGINSSFTRCTYLDEARLQAKLKEGLILIDSFLHNQNRILLYKNDEPVFKNYCLFARKELKNPYFFELFDIFKRTFLPFG